MILLILLSGLFPSDSYEAGHYFPTMASCEVGYTMTHLYYEIFDDDADPNRVEYKAIWFGALSSVVAGQLFKKHYQTPTENYWGMRGILDWYCVRMPIFYLRLELNRRKERKATLEQWIEKEGEI